MYIIADAGSTKTKWIFVDDDRTQRSFIGAGINPVHQSEGEIIDILAISWEGFSTELFFESPIYFYGSGCIGGEANRRISDALSAMGFCGPMEIASDMVGAARALFGDSSGIACIIGTGSNACVYDGSIKRSARAMGYILGDEGSGTDIGKRLLNLAFKEYDPIALSLQAEIGLSYEQVVERTYRQPNANRFLASVAPIALKFVDERVVAELLRDAFSSFLQKNVFSLGEEAKSLPIGFVGGIANAFKDKIIECLRPYNVCRPIFVDDVAARLAVYHDK